MITINRQNCRIQDKPQHPVDQLTETDHYGADNL